MRLRKLKRRLRTILTGKKDAKHKILLFNQMSKLGMKEKGNLKIVEEAKLNEHYKHGFDYLYAITKRV